MRATPADGATAKDEAGNVFKFAGGAPVHLSSCSVGCGNPVPITAWSIRTLDHMRPVPADGTTVTTENGSAAPAGDALGAPVPLQGHRDRGTLRVDQRDM